MSSAHLWRAGTACLFAGGREVCCGTSAAAAASQDPAESCRAALQVASLHLWLLALPVSCRSNAHRARGGGGGPDGALSCFSKLNPHTSAGSLSATHGVPLDEKAGQSDHQPRHGTDGRALRSPTCPVQVTSVKVREPLKHVAGQFRYFTRTTVSTAPMGAHSHSGLPQPGGLSERLWMDVQLEVAHSLLQPFVISLAAGTLPRLAAQTHVEGEGRGVRKTGPALLHPVLCYTVMQFAAVQRISGLSCRGCTAVAWGGHAAPSRPAAGRLEDPIRARHSLYAPPTQ